MIISYTMKQITKTVVVGFAIGSLASLAFAAPTLAVEADDNISGATPYTLPGPVTGTLNGDGGTSADRDDVYSVSLEAGKTYKMTLVPPEKSTTGTKAIQFALKLFGPSATDVTTGTALDGETSPTSSDESGDPGRQVLNLTYTPTISGTYFIDADATSGNGSYTLYFAELASNEKCPGRRVSYGTYTSVTLNPAENKFQLCFSIAISSTKAQSLHVRSLTFPGAVTGLTNEVELDIFGPDGDSFSCFGDVCAPFQTIGADIFKPSRIGLHSFLLGSHSFLPPTFSFTATKRLATDLELSTSVSQKKKKGGYRAVAVGRLTPKQKRVKVTFTFRRCNSAGTKCRTNKVRTKRTSKRGVAKAAVVLKSGRYDVSAKFGGSSKRLSSQSLPECLAVGPTGTCIESSSR